MSKVTQSANDGVPTAIASPQNTSPAKGGPLMELMSLPIELIDMQPNRPRRATVGVEFDGLVESIKTVGQTTPVIVVQPEPESGRFEMRAGERRLNACRQLGHTYIQAIVVVSEYDAALGLIDNLLTEDLPPLDEAAWLKQIKNDMTRTDDNLAAMLGRSRSSITQTLGIANIPATMQEMIRALDEPASRDSLIELSKCEDDQERQAVFELIKSAATQLELREQRKKNGTGREQSVGNRKVVAFLRMVDRVLKLEEQEDALTEAWTPTAEEIAHVQRCIKLFNRLIGKPGRKAMGTSVEAAEDTQAALH